MPIIKNNRKNEEGMALERAPDLNEIEYILKTILQ